MTRKVAVVTDSTTYIPEDILSQHDIHVAPTVVIWGGKEYYDNVNITGDGSMSGSMKVTWPVGGDSWQANTGHNITWNRSFIWGTVRIDLSINGGHDWNTIIPSTPNNGSAFWTPTDAHVSDNCYIRVVSLENTAVRDVNDNAF